LQVLHDEASGECRVKVYEFISNLGTGGAETLVKDYALEIDKTKIDFGIITVWPDTNMANGRIIEEVKIKRLSIFKTHNFFTKIFRRLFGRLYIPIRLKRIIVEEKPNCIHTHLQLLRYIKPISKHLKKIALLYTCHSTPKRMFQGKNIIEGKCAKYLIDNLDMRMIALHKEMADEINQMFDIKNTAIVKNGVNFDKFRNIEETKTQIRNSIDVPENAFIIGHVGRFSYPKNHNLLVDIFNKVSQRRDDAFLLMVGDGSLKHEILQKIDSLGLNDKVKILSNRTDIPRLLKSMDVFVFPSRFEGLSVALVEVQVAGLRAIVSNRINEETILSQNTIVVDEYENTDRWCDLILDDKMKNTNFGIIDDFEMKKCICDLENLYISEFKNKKER
jgi:glycosyltransferase involved in cell wall biosynthesis